jgi:acetylornithine/N-succinyldiaminopimelate aminotransferase
MSSLFWYPGTEVKIKDAVRAENCQVITSSGRRYVDLESGIWCTGLGHSRPELLKVMADQAGRISHTGYCYTNDVVENAAEKVLALLGFEGGKCNFLCSGSEAVEFGVRVAKEVIGRPLLMTMADSYFGAYGSAAKKDPDEWYSFDWTNCATCSDETACGPDCTHWTKIPFERIGGFLFEPGSSAGMVRFPPKKLVENLDQEMKKTGGLMLVNEVTTGMGRTAKWFGFQHYDIVPDIVALGKGIGNGYPVSVTGFAPGVVERLGDAPIKYAQSHQNDPLGAAIAGKVIDIFQNEGLIARAGMLSDILLPGLEAIGRSSPRVADLRGRGLMAALELQDDASASFTTRVYEELLDAGYIVAKRPGINLLRIDPPLTIAEEDLRGFLEALKGIVA